MKPRVLIVDDDEKNVILLNVKMEREGYEVETASNGFDGIKKVESFQPDIVLLDVMMPGIDGYETLRRIKSKEQTRYIPIIMLTGLGEVDDKVMGFEVGAEDYITKPFSLREVSARVKSLLRMRALQTRLRDTEKMAALGGMVDGIAHEVRNPLAAMGGMARRLYDHETDPLHKRYAGGIITCVERLERMMQRIDEYKSILSSKLEKGDINKVVEAAVKDALDLVDGKDIEIKTSLMDAPPPVKMDFVNLKTALFNVLQNSMEAIEKKGGIMVETLPYSGDTLLVRISDNGAGINPDEIRRIFRPFQTSKIEGAGLGLTITYRIVQDHGGEITVESKKGEGTVMSIWLHPMKGVVREKKVKQGNAV